MLAELDGERYHALLVALDGLVTSPPLTERAAAAGRQGPSPTGRPQLRARCARSWQEAEATPAGAEREELLHDARKAAKRARYAGESVSRVFGKDAAAFAAAMEDVQEALGEHQDSVLTRERLRDLARHTSSTDAAFLYGRLHALEEAGARRVAAALRRGVEGGGSQAAAPLAALTPPDGDQEPAGPRSPVSHSRVVAPSRCPWSPPAPPG